MAWRRLLRNPWGAGSLALIVIYALLALFAYVIAPDNSANANQMHIAIPSQEPGFTVDMLLLPAGGADKGSNFLTGYASSCTEIPVEQGSVRVDGDQVHYQEYVEGPEVDATKTAQFDPAAGTPLVRQQTFLLGTDKYGRDLLSRLLVGARISLAIGLVAVLISLLIGIPVGAIAGYYGGKIDAAIMWVINVTWSIPTLLLVIAITVALGKGFWQVFIAVGLTMWVEVARVVRGQVIAAREQQYVTAARALGYNDRRIITKHVLPNVLAPVIVISAANFAAAILIESGLSFLGIGAQPPTPSWGAMIKDHYQYIILGKAWLAIIPGLAIMSLVMAFMLAGNALRDALDVKSTT